MQANTIYYTGQLVSTLIGSDILTKAISDTAGTIYNLLYGLVDNGDPELDRVLEELDVYAQMKCVDSLTQTLDTHSITKTLHVCLEQLHEIICRIREDLRQIQKNMESHRELYFASYRLRNNKEQITNLRRHKHTLDQRMDMLIKVIQIEQLPNVKALRHPRRSLSSGGTNAIQDISTTPIRQESPWIHVEKVKRKRD
jgi:hypothetical protein